MTRKLTPWRAYRAVRAAAAALDAHDIKWFEDVDPRLVVWTLRDKLVIQQVFGYGFRRDSVAWQLWCEHHAAFQPGNSWNAWWLAAAWRSARARRCNNEWYHALWSY